MLPMKHLLFTIVCILGILKTLHAQQIIPLYEHKIPNSKPIIGLTDTALVLMMGNKMGRFITRVASPELIVYLPDKKKATGMAVIICPGGGYGGLAIDHEGHDIAKKLNEYGIAGFVLKYRLPKNEYVNNKAVVPLQDAQRAIQLVREKAKNWGISPNKIGIQGNSAGGHLAATVGTHYRKEYINNVQKTSLRPDFIILNYPVISFADSLTHYGSRFNLVGEMDAAELNKMMSDWKNSEQKLEKVLVLSEKIAEYSNELHITPNTPPTFITHAIDDDVVKVQNSLVFIAALQQNNVPLETFFYAKGGHGYGMYNPTSNVQWIDNCIRWMLKMR
jgi:acetyl esterase/lipase